MRAFSDRKKLQRSGPLLASTLLVAGALGGCYNGQVTEQVDQDDILYRDISGVARPGDPTKLGPITFAPRATFGSANSADALGYPNLPPEGRALMDTTDPNSPLTFFTIPHTDAEGVGPLFNQRRCLGCHFSSTDVRDNNLQDSVRFNGQVFTTLNTVNTPVSRAARQGPTNFDYIHDNYRPNTAAFTLFGDYFPATGQFDPIEILGGPLQHVHSVSLTSNGCVSEIQPPMSRDPFLQGGIDPATGLSMLGAFRAIGERAGPPYIGRGLMEAIYYADLLSNEDFQDLVDDTEPCLAGGTAPAGFRGCSSLLPVVDHSVCPGDCISGRHNEGRADINVVGGEPLQRVGRFGLRAAGTTMLQFDIGGTRGEIGLTSLLAPTEEPFPQNNVNRGCDQPADPEIRVEVVRNLRAMIRLFAPPDYVADFRQQPPTTPLAIELQAGAALFGLDMRTFLSRTTAGQQAIGFGDYNADRGMAVDRQLNCVACHVPIQRTGESPAQIAPDVLSNKWAPIFSDLLIHALPMLPQGRPEYLYPNVYQGAGIPALRAYYDAVFANGFSRPGLSRQLGDAVVPGPDGAAPGRPPLRPGDPDRPLSTRAAPRQKARPRRGRSIRRRPRPHGADADERPAPGARRQGGRPRGLPRAAARPLAPARQRHPDPPRRQAVAAVPPAGDRRLRQRQDRRRRRHRRRLRGHRRRRRGRRRCPRARRGYRTVPAAGGHRPRPGRCRGGRGVRGGGGDPWLGPQSARRARHAGEGDRGRRVRLSSGAAPDSVPDVHRGDRGTRGRSGDVGDAGAAGP